MSKPKLTDVAACLAVAGIDKATSTQVLTAMMRDGHIAKDDDADGGEARRRRGYARSYNR
jgi:hypothetical protein